MKKSRKVLIILSIMITLLTGLWGCRHSPVFQKIIYNSDAPDIDYDNLSKMVNNNMNNRQEDEDLSTKKEKDDADKTRDRNKNNGIYGENGEDTSGDNVKYSNTASSDLNAGQNPNQEESLTNPDGTGQGETGDNPDEPDPNPRSKGAVKQILDGDGNPAVVPENVKTVTAVGNAASIVQMLGGSGRLAATSKDFYSNPLVQSVFSDESVGTVPVLWEGNGSSRISDADFSTLLSIWPDVCFVISGQSTFSDSQITALKQEGCYYVVLPKLRTADDIKNAVSIVAEVLWDKSAENGTNAPALAEEYNDYFDNIIAEVSSRVKRFTYNDIDYNNDWQPGTSEKTIESNNKSGHYSLFISGWDEGASYSLVESGGSIPLEKGAAMVKTGYSSSPLSYYMSLAGVVNTAATHYDQDRTYYISPMVNYTREPKVVGGNAYFDEKYQMLEMENESLYLGDDRFKAVIVNSEATKTRLQNDLVWRNISTPQQLDGSTVFGFYDNNNFIPTAIRNNYEIYVNPSGVSKWSEATAESILEPVWIAYKFYGEFGKDTVEQKVKEFYKKFYRHDLSSAELSEILAY